MIKTIFFDIGGVLVDLHPERTEALLAEATGLSGETLREVFPEAAHHQYERGFLDDTQFFQEVKRALPDSTPLSETIFWKAWMAMVGEAKRTADWIPRLRERVPVWLLSNTNRHHVTHLLPDYPFYSAVDGAVFSYETGSRKPEPGIFQEALRQTKQDPGQALFIDDLKPNVEAAETQGFLAIQFHSPEQLAHELTRLGFPID
ncbi:MAG: HAD family phosphatase [FCB group bacterium]|nr:HAD family phosphatase [FCB group bacterium]